MTTPHDDLARREEAEALAFSRPLDIHRWSEDETVYALVEQVGHICFDGDPTKFERKHLKVVLLDLYIASVEHPDLKLFVPMRSAEYKAKDNRYNALRVSKLIITVVHRLRDAGLINVKRGYLDRLTGDRKRTRIWSTSRLLALFQQSKLDASKVGRAADEEVVILRDDDKEKVQYKDTPDTDRMRHVLREYNALLAQSFIDIRRLDQPWIKLRDGSRLLVGPVRQRACRVFNRSSFDKGGRFFGPWWQGCPKEWRREVFINDAPTIEQDYSSLHIALLYARKGINYYTAYEGDAYQVETPDFLEGPEQTRKYAKLLLLMAVNAKDDNATYSAFRQARNDKKDKVGGRLTNDQLSRLLTGLRDKHPAIAEYLASDAGIDLMNEDSRITEHVIKTFTAQGIPVLTVHDSYIVNWACHHLLQRALEDGFRQVTGLSGVKADRTGVVMDDAASWETERLGVEALTRSHGYIQRQLTWMTSRPEEQVDRRLPA